MKNILMELLVATVVFLLFKCFLVMICKILNRVFRAENIKRKKYDFGISLALQLIFILGWYVTIESSINMLELTNFQCYISICLIGIFCVIWCYFSWDVEHIFVKPCKASADEKRIKKILIYFLLFAFALVQGYYQTLHVIDANVEVDSLVSITNYSIVVVTIAFDRFMNQIVQD